MRITTTPLFFATLAASGASLTSAQTTTVQITYQPAIGFFLCPEEGMVCNVEGCGGESCSIIANDYSKSIVDGKTVYTATAAEASLTISGGDGSIISCDSSCECQDLIGNGDGCNLPIGEKEDPLEGGIVNEEEQEEEETQEKEREEDVVRSIEDSSGASVVSVAGGMALAVAMMHFFL